MKPTEITEIGSPRRLGAEIRRLRREQRLTQTELADLSGVSVMFVSQVERGKETAELGKVLRLLHMLGARLVLEAPPATGEL
jgi:y4mF family transcriptional regulator